MKVTIGWAPWWKAIVTFFFRHNSVLDQLSPERRFENSQPGIIYKPFFNRALQNSKFKNGMRKISKGTKNVNDWERERERKGEDNTKTYKNLTLLLLEWNAIFFNSSSTYVLKQEKTITQCLLAVWNISKLHISVMCSVYLNVFKLYGSAACFSLRDFKAKGVKYTGKNARIWLFAP